MHLYSTINKNLMESFLIQFFTPILKLFYNFGRSSICMDDIAYRLYISKKTFYKEYACNDALVKDIYLNDFTCLGPLSIRWSRKKLITIFIMRLNRIQMQGSS